MHAITRGLHAVVVAMALAATPGATASHELVAADADGAGGGALAGGSYTAFSTIAAAGDATPMRGGEFEATSGLERRRDPPPSGPIFTDGFE